MDRVRGRRFDNEPKLNMKKVFATIIAIIVFIMVIISIKSLFKSNEAPSELNIQTSYFTVFENVDGSCEFKIKTDVLNKNSGILNKISSFSDLTDRLNKLRCSDEEKH